MPEAEDVITDVARHATNYARELWRRHRKNASCGPQRQRVALPDIVRRLDLLITAVFGRSYPIRIAQRPAAPTFLTKVFKQGEGPRHLCAIPATDGVSIWLPAELPVDEPMLALEHYRVLALQQATRAARGSTRILATVDGELQRAIFTVLEAQAADAALAQLLPGTRSSLHRLRAFALQSRPTLTQFPRYRQPLEQFVRTLLGAGLGDGTIDDPAESVKLAGALANQFGSASLSASRRQLLLFSDCWTGELRQPPAATVLMPDREALVGQRPAAVPRSARLTRRPEVRESADNEDDKSQGAWMVQTAQPHEQAEDPFGMQRPTDRDDSAAADEFADALSELAEARLVSSPGSPKEVLLSEDVPALPARRQAGACTDSEPRCFRYPEWDYRSGTYREHGATIRLLAPQEGPEEWIDRTLGQYRSMLHQVRRRFEMLRAQRVWLRKQSDGEEVDIDAYIDSYSDFKAGLPMAEALYQTCRPDRRNMAIVLLIDVSGSTDGWICANKRVIDIEREALLLVSIALQGLAEPYAMMAFSGEGPHGVTVRLLKSFAEQDNQRVAARIAGLEPEHYTRAGAAIRHATAELMRQAAKHRLLLLLSDGKPNDVDDYEGRYGVEDMRQAITEAKMHGVNPFCLTIDRQAAHYLPAIFGVRHYALLPRPELLPTVLLEWMKRLIVA